MQSQKKNPLLIAALMWGIACCSLTAAQAGDELPAYAAKPDAWKTGLSTHAGGPVWDKAFAGWVQTSQARAHQLVAGNWKLSFRFTFTQCYSGGFLTEIKNADPQVSLFGANSSVKYFQGASADETDPDETKWNSRYAHSWQNRAEHGAGQVPVHDDKKITLKAFLALRDGNVEGIPRHSRIGIEQPQYVVRGDPEDLKTADARFAILFAGDPEKRHRNNVTAMRKVLIDKYGYKADDIWILYGAFEGAKPPGAEWKSNAKGTAAQLEKAFTEDAGFLLAKIKAYANGEPLNDKKIKVFFWATDHGTVDAPITLSVDEDSEGLKGTDVKAKDPNPQGWVYEGGTNTNTVKGRPAAVADDVNALSFGRDAVIVSDGLGMYFSVDRDSAGVVRSGVHRVGKMKAPAGVFAATLTGNREMVKGATVGLVDTEKEHVDNLNALSMVPISVYRGIPGHEADLALTTTFFYSLKGSAQIWVWDPFRGGGAPVKYLFWDPATAPWPRDDNGEFDPPKPEDIDALSMNINVSRMCRNGFGDLVFKPGRDRIIFSVPNGDPMGGSGADIWLYTGPAVENIRTPADLGLVDDDEVDALHTHDPSSPYRVHGDEEDNDPDPQDAYSFAPCPGDLNFDGQVDTADLLDLLAQWGSTAECTPWMDTNGDGTIDSIDLISLLAAWGECP